MAADAVAALDRCAAGGGGAGGAALISNAASGVRRRVRIGDLRDAANSLRDRSSFGHRPMGYRRTAMKTIPFVALGTVMLLAGCESIMPAKRSAADRSISRPPRPADHCRTDRHWPRQFGPRQRSARACRGGGRRQRASRAGLYPGGRRRPGRAPGQRRFVHGDSFRACRQCTGGLARNHHLASRGAIDRTGCRDPPPFRWVAPLAGPGGHLPSSAQWRSGNIGRTTRPCPVFGVSGPVGAHYQGALIPPIQFESPMAIQISSAFDAGNIRVVKQDGDLIDLEIVKDHMSDFYQWFHFRLAGARRARSDACASPIAARRPTRTAGPTIAPACRSTARIGCGCPTPAMPTAC